MMITSKAMSYADVVQVPKPSLRGLRNLTSVLVPHSTDGHERTTLTAVDTQLQAHALRSRRYAPPR